MSIGLGRRMWDTIGRLKPAPTFVSGTDVGSAFRRTVLMAAVAALLS